MLAVIVVVCVLCYLSAQQDCKLFEGFISLEPKTASFTKISMEKQKKDTYLLGPDCHTFVMMAFIAKRPSWIDWLS